MGMLCLFGETEKLPNTYSMSDPTTLMGLTIASFIIHASVGLLVLSRVRNSASIRCMCIAFTRQLNDCDLPFWFETMTANIFDVCTA